jgi:excisionase family DNA binding protein
MLEELKAKRSAMTVKEIADILSLSPREIYRLAATNQIPHFRIGASVRFDARTVLVWLESRMQTPATRYSPSSARPSRRHLPISRNSLDVPARKPLGDCDYGIHIEGTSLQM